MRASQVWRFFCVVSPGHEASALEEFQAKAAALSATPLEAIPVQGGFEVETSWEVGRGLTHLLKIPTRVVVRLTQVSARDFPKMYQALLKLPWTQWLQHPEPQLRISASECRLMHTGRVEETFRSALKAAHQKQPFSTRYQTENLPADLLLLRGEQDRWTLSLDLAGEALYKRGDFTVKNHAPLRETHAAAVLWQFFKNYQGPAVELIDPMCGSGTLLKEALSFFTPTVRSFSYQTSPLNKGVFPWKPKAALASWPIQKAIGLDIDQALLAQLKASAGLEFHHHDLLQNPQLMGSDTRWSDTRWVISNPPYGERLAVNDQFARKLGESLARYQAQRVALVVPRSFPTITVAPLKLQQRYPFSHGGLAVELRVFY